VFFVFGITRPVIVDIFGEILEISDSESVFAVVLTGAIRDFKDSLVLGRSGASEPPVGFPSVTDLLDCGSSFPSPGSAFWLSLISTLPACPYIVPLAYLNIYLVKLFCFMWSG